MLAREFPLRYPKLPIADLEFVTVDGIYCYRVSWFDALASYTLREVTTGRLIREWHAAPLVPEKPLPADCYEVSDALEQCARELLDVLWSGSDETADDEARRAALDRWGPGVDVEACQEARLDREAAPPHLQGPRLAFAVVRLLHPIAGFTEPRTYYVLRRESEDGNGYAAETQGREQWASRFVVEHGRRP